MNLNWTDMLIEFKIQNYTSFNTEQVFSMVSSSSTKENLSTENTIPLNKFGINSLLKSAAIFGANAGGKSNFVSGLSTFKTIVLNSLTAPASQGLDMAVPFLIKENRFDIPIEFEVTFITSDIMFRYGISINRSKVNEEWLFWTKEKRETNLFHRIGQKIKTNNRSFSEARSFQVEINNEMYVEKTREDVPFIAVLAQFNGEISKKIIEWFTKLHVVSGISDTGFQRFTTKLFEENARFKAWALDILASVQIHDIKIVETKETVNINLNDEVDVEGKKLITSIHDYLEKQKLVTKNIEIVKTNHSDNKKYKLPLFFESHGTQKLIYLLGPIWDVINRGDILVVDEFDNRFHSLLSKFIVKLYNNKNNSLSQLLITCHDTNLLTKDLFRRDQIWFVEKNQKHESVLYSLLEYREYYTRKNDSYSKEYLLGKYGAIPLFSNIKELLEVLNG